jgi:hypothetical protein
MPRREDIEKFAHVLNSLGDEPAIRAARSESIEEVPAVGADAPGGAPSASDELDTLGLAGEAGAGAGEAGTSEAESLQDIFASLSDIPEEGAEAASGEEAAPGPGEAGAEAGPEAPAAGGEEGLDFASLFGEESAAPAIEDLGQPAAPRGREARGGRGAGPAPISPPEKAAAEEEPFSFPGGEPESLQSDLDQMESLPDEGTGLETGLDTGAEVGGTGGEPAAEPAAEGEAFEDLGALSFPIEPGSEETPSESAPSEAGEGDAGLGDLASFEEPQAGTGSLDAPGGEPGSEPAGEPAAGESFDLPSLDDLTFAEPGAAPSQEAEPSFEEPAREPVEAEAPQGEEPAPAFDLDTAGFEETTPEAEAGPFPTEPPSGAPAAEPDAAGLEGLSEGEESLGDLDQFSLPESAGQFGAPDSGGEEQLAMPQGGGEPSPAPAARPGRPARPERKARPQPRAAAAVPAEPAPEISGPGGEIELTPEQFARLKSTLDSLPRNLKIVVQDLIGEGTAGGPDLSALVGLLVRAASAQEIAALAGRISGKRIRIPAGYEKKSGLAFEAEQRTFAYAFRENIWPLIRVFVITVIVGGMFGLLGYWFVARPVFAYVNYRAGYAQIANDRFTVANERFARATSVWPLKQWYYRYAEAFAQRRSYQLAEQKYEDLLKRWPGDKRGILDYARLETTRLADYQKADTLLKRYLDAHVYDYDVLLASGDNYLAWAERDKTKYEPARLAYATLLDHGVKDELLFRMLRYFIRTDNGEEVERLRAFYAARPETKVDAAAFAELGGYLIDHRRMDFAQDVLLRADGAQRGLYDVHYNLARYYRLVQDPDDEKKALDATKQILDLTRNTDPLTTRRLGVEIDTHTRLGEYYYRRQQYLPAQTELQEAIRLVETNQRMGLIDKGPLYGRPYAALGDLSYYIEGNLQNAARQYQSAAANRFTSPLLTYKIGYVQYSQGDYKSALASFADAEDASAYPSSADLLVPAAPPGGQAGGTPAGAQAAPGVEAAPGAVAAPGSSASTAVQPASAQALNPVGQPPQNLLYALGDAFYQRGDFFAAQASFLRLRERLETRRAALGILHPEDRSEDRALLDALVKVNNNLGVTMFRLGERTADRRKKSEALVYLSAANEILSSLTRSPDTVRRSEDRNLPSLNMRGILYPLTGSIPEIYSDLPRDFQAADW